ncbi:MAG: glycosyltransferase family 9 protein [Verrucomicrobiota bacterium]
MNGFTPVPITTTAAPRILILRGGALGDFLLTLPAIRALRRHWPEAWIEIIGHPGMAELAMTAGLINCVRSLDTAGMAEWFVPRRVWPERERADLASFDLILSYLGDAAGVLHANLQAAGAKRVIACSPIVASGLPAEAALAVAKRYGGARSAQAGHAADHFLHPVMELGGSKRQMFDVAAVRHCRMAAKESTPLPARLPGLKSPPMDISQSTGNGPLLAWPTSLREQGRHWLKELGLAGDVISLHPGSGSSRKNWPVEKFALLADCVRRSMSAQPLFILGEADADAKRALPRLMPAVPVLTNRTLKEVASVLAVSRGYVGNDSGITHLAAALGIPVVALFGPTDAAMWGPRGAHVVILRGRAPTSEALAAIEPETVLQVLEKLIGS